VYGPSFPPFCGAEKVRAVRDIFHSTNESVQRRSKYNRCLTSPLTFSGSVRPISRAILSFDMAPSQLKQLKASLRERGVVGPQKSKKQKQKAAKSGAAAADRVKRNAVLQELREQFNPFEIRAPARPSKFAVTTRANTEPSRHRPGVTRGLGEVRVCALHRLSGFNTASANLCAT
jgi:hypothetical protein